MRCNDFNLPDKAEPRSLSQFGFVFSMPGCQIRTSSPILIPSEMRVQVREPETIQ
jgi:hypothetical protein